jgi:hypothetical protein
VRFEFHPDALAGYEEAAWHYAACQAGLELRLIDAVEHAVHLILDVPDKWVMHSHREPSVANQK